MMMAEVLESGDFELLAKIAGHTTTHQKNHQEIIPKSNR
jgi:hypothetical protein